ncbi:MAG TPA: hypothetical protein VIL34_11710 [Actinopolymorphaceae bacterium]|jgi:hypothetical protein
MDNRGVRIVAVTVAIIAVLAVAALLVTTYRNASSTPVTSTESPSAPPATPEPVHPTSPTPSSPVADGHDHEPVYEPDAQAATAIRSVTVKFLNEWKRPGTPEERTKRIRPYATAWLAERLGDVDPAELPRSRIVGSPQIVAATPYAAGTTTRFSDGLRVRCNLVLDTSGWRVAEVLPDTDGPPSPSPRASSPQGGDV